MSDRYNTESDKNFNGTDGYNVTINAADDTSDSDETINNVEDDVTIETGMGNDTIANLGSEVIINSGAGNDYVENYGNSVAIAADTGNDYLLNVGDSVTLDGGAGNDTIGNIGSEVTINAGEGNDLIENYTSNDATITIGSTVQIDAGAGKDTVSNYSDHVTLSGGADNDNITNSGENVLIEGDSGDDYIFSTGNNVTITGGLGIDTISNNGTNVIINGGLGSEFIANSGSNISINGSSGNDTIYNETGENIIIDGGKGDDLIFLDSAQVQINYNAGDGNDTIFGFGEETTLNISGDAFSSATGVGGSVVLTVDDKEILLVNAASLSAINIVSDFPQGLTYSRDKKTLTAGPNFKDPSIDLKHYDKRVRIFDASALSDNLKIIGNSFQNTLIGGSGDDEFTGGKGKNLFVYNGGKKVITDYDRSKDKINLSGASIADVELSDGDLTFTFDDGNSLTINDFDGKDISFFDGTKTTKNYFDDHAILDGSKKGATLQPAATEFSAENYSGLVTIHAESVSSAVSITGNRKANRIYAGDAGATIDGGKGNDSLFGGGGTDIFRCENKSGNKFIFNYETNDTLSLVNAEVTDAFVKGSNDVVFKAGGKKITFKDAANKEITFSEDGTIKTFSDGAIYNKDKTSATLTAKYSSKTVKNFDATVTNIDASAAGKNTNLVASSDDNTTILGGKGKDSLTGSSGDDILRGGKGNDLIQGGAGADSLWGNKGNDTLYGGDDNDTFFYSKGDGKDVIFGFENGDVLNLTDITNITGKVNAAGTEVYIKAGSTNKAITFKNFTATEFNISAGGETGTYRISNGAFVKD